MGNNEEIIKKLANLYRLNKKIPNPEESVKRWFSDNEVIKFTNYNFIQKNIELTINNENNWKIWFSQLNESLYIGSLSKALVSTITLKSGEILNIPQLSTTEFREITQNKTFRVIISGTGYAPNKYNQKCQELNQYYKIYEFVHNHIITNDSEQIKEMLRPKSTYNFIEL